MKKCPVCGRTNPEITTRCFGCDRLLPVAEDPPAPRLAPPLTEPMPPDPQPDPKPALETAATAAPAPRWSRRAKAAAGGVVVAGALGVGILLAGPGGGGSDPDPTKPLADVGVTTTVASNGFVSTSAFENCDDARAAGATPLREGDPGYRPGLDRDGDGVACE